MSKNLSWEDNKVSDKNIFVFAMFVFGLVIVLLLGINSPKESTKNQAENNTLESSEIKISQCKQNIHEATMYNLDRLNYIGNEQRSLIVTYLNDSGSVHKFKCTGNTIQLYANGAKQWIEM